MSVFVDTSVWSLVLRRDAPPNIPEVGELRRILAAGEIVLSTGIVLQELLQGFNGPRAREQILQHYTAIPLLTPDRQDHVAAADLRNRCRRAGFQVGTTDALLAQLCTRHELTMLTTDRDFDYISEHSKLVIWKPVA